MPCERTKPFSRGSNSASVTAPVNDKPASVKKAPPVKRKAGQRHEAAAPADEIAEQARNEAAGKSTEARSRDIDAGDARHLRRRPFIADIGDGDREDRRQQQTLKKAPGDERLHV